MIIVIFFLTMAAHLCLLLFLLLTLTKVFGELTARGVSSTPTVGTVPGRDRTGQDSPATTAAYSQSFLFACFSPVVISCRSVYQTQHFINAVQKLHHWIEPPAHTFSFGNDLN